MRKSLIAIVFFLAAILSSGCVELYGLLDSGLSDNGYFDNNPIGDRSVTGGMHGTVTDYKDNPLDGAVVSLIGDEFTYSGRTGKDGMYNITGVPAGTYSIVVKKEGYDDRALPEFTILEDYSYKWDIMLSPTYVPSTTGNLHGAITDRKNISWRVRSSS